MDIVTGYRGEPHVTSNAHQAFNYGIAGDCILPVGEKLRPELTATKLIIHDGELIHKGVHSRITPGTSDEIPLSTGDQGMRRIDLVCAKYSKANNNVETSEWVVKRGTPTSGNPSAPSYTDGDVVAGQVVSELPVFRIEYNGISASVSQLLPVVMNASTLSSRISELPRVLAKGAYVIGSTVTASDDVTIYTLPSWMVTTGNNPDTNYVAVAVTNGNYSTNQTQMFATYIVKENRTVHVKMSARTAWCQLNYIIWYWGPWRA